jgi:hypothetical protein
VGPQKRGAPFEPLEIGPGAHLQVEIGGVEFESDVFVQLLDHRFAEHEVLLSFVGLGTLAVFAIYEYTMPDGFHQPSPTPGGRIKERRG